MVKLVTAGKKQPRVRQRALSLTQNLLQKDRLGETKAIFEFVRDHIRYVRDINGVETLHEAQQVLAQRSGDCDDKAILLASMLESIGIPTKFWAIGFKPGHFSHVLVEARPLGEWIVLETTHPVPMGWRPPNIKASMRLHNK